MTNPIRNNYILSPEQRHAGYSVEFDGDQVYLYHNGTLVESLDVGFVTIQTISCIRQAAQNHMEMSKSGIEFGKMGAMK